MKTIRIKRSRLNEIIKEEIKSFYLNENDKLPKWITPNNIKNIKNVKFEYDEDKNFVWINGTWIKGTWEYGTWKNGTWKFGTWEDGEWEDGTWENGTWENGTWIKGTWEYGIWKNGKWKFGTWKNGYWNDGYWNDGYWNDGTWLNGTWIKGTWEDGIWLNGTWEDGEWENGKWENGKWENGKWENGTWEDGEWENGIWENGIWENGTWEDGTWENGTWLNGEWEDGKIYSKKFDEYIESKINPAEFKKLEKQSNTIKEFKNEIKIKRSRLNEMVKEEVKKWACNWCGSKQNKELKESVTVDDYQFYKKYIPNNLHPEWMKTFDIFNAIIDGRDKTKYDASKVKKILNIVNTFSRKHDLGIKFLDIKDIQIDTENYPIITWELEPSPSSGPAGLYEQEVHNYFPIVTIVGSKEDRLFSRLFNKKISSQKTETGRKRTYKVNKSDIPKLIGKLRAEGSAFANSWANDIQDSLGQFKYSSLEETLGTQGKYKSDEDIEKEFRNPKIEKFEQNPFKNNDNVWQITVSFPHGGESVGGGTDFTVERFSFDPETKNELWFRTNHWYPEKTYKLIRTEIAKFLKKKYNLSTSDYNKLLKY